MRERDTSLCQVGGGHNTKQSIQEVCAHLRSTVLFLTPWFVLQFMTTGMFTLLCSFETGKILDELSLDCVSPEDCPVCAVGDDRIPHGKRVVLNRDDPQHCQSWYDGLCREPASLLCRMKVSRMKNILMNESMNVTLNIPLKKKLGNIFFMSIPLHREPRAEVFLWE